MTTDAPVGLSLPFVAEYRDASCWSSCRPAGVASSDCSSYSAPGESSFGSLLILAEGKRAQPVAQQPCCS